jgi:hypothetical protein
MALLAAIAAAFLILHILVGTILLRPSVDSAAESITGSVPETVVPQPDGVSAGD